MNFKKIYKKTAFGLMLSLLILSGSISVPAIRDAQAKTKEVTADRKKKNAIDDIEQIVKEVDQATSDVTSIIDASKVKKITNEVNKDASTGRSSGGVVAKVYKDHSGEMKKKKETIHGFVYFNQTDKEWNDNGYQIRHSGCGPTSMAVVISSLTGKWVTPVETAAWAYEHHYYSAAGSKHSVVNALATEYGLTCEGVGRNKSRIKKALQEGNPVVVLMGPGYFTKGGHFMVLVDIDDEDNVTVADVASRKRSSYKYALDSIISQSKGATNGGPFWIISGGKELDETTVWQRDEVSLSYQSLKNVNAVKLRKCIREGGEVMLLTDGQLIGKQHFVYLVGIESNDMVMVMDTNYQNGRQYPLSEVVKHMSKDVTGISAWKVKGENVDFLMPLSKNAL
ncbi:MAG: C39 family peptidase [Lachnospiraceae bacterium]|nr:C39 family peptidase [Lachnospiraceae bacterium]